MNKITHKHHSIIPTTATPINKQYDAKNTENPILLLAKRAYKSYTDPQI